jgi:hypothetical protein
MKCFRLSCDSAVVEEEVISQTLKLARSNDNEQSGTRDLRS